MLRYNEVHHDVDDKGLLVSDFDCAVVLQEKSGTGQ